MHVLYGVWTRVVRGKPSTWQGPEELYTHVRVYIYIYILYIYLQDLVFLCHRATRDSIDGYAQWDKMAFFAYFAQLVHTQPLCLHDATISILHCKEDAFVSGLCCAVVSTASHKA